MVYEEQMFENKGH